jgi:hypothetical protein
VPDCRGLSQGAGRPCGCHLCHATASSHPGVMVAKAGQHEHVQPQHERKHGNDQA